MNRILPTAMLSVALIAGTPALSQAQALPTVLKIDKPAAGTSILIAVPEVSMALLTTSGPDPKEEWTQTAKKFLNTAALNGIKSRGYDAVSVDPAAYEGSRDLQMLKLNDAVTSAIQYTTYVKLPTKTSFDWTVGEGAAELRPEGAATPAAYVLFMNATGNYVSGGRIVAGAILAAVSGGGAGGAYMSGGGQTITATLVDLSTGKIVWYKTAAYSGMTDLRTEAGDNEAMDKLFKDLPL